MDQRHYEELRSLVKSSLDEETKKRLKDELLQLSDREKAEFARKMKLDDELEKPAKNEFRGVGQQKGKIALVEYINQDQNFMLRSAFLAMENYIFDRFRTAKMEPAERETVSKFLSIIFDHSASNHVDTIYDVFVKPLVRERDESMLNSEAQINPAYIPKPIVKEFDNFNDVTLDCNIVKCKFHDAETSVEKYSNLVTPTTIEEMRELEMQERWFIVKKDKLVPMPSYSQIRNASNYFINKYEEHRMLTSIIYQQNPKQELIVHLHGLFDSIEKADEYRIKNSDKIHDKVVVVPVGYTAIAGDFRANRDGITMYNPSDPEIELMINGKHNIRRAEANVMKKRTMTKLAERANPETLKMIRNFNKQKELLRTKGEKKVREKLSKDENYNDAMVTIECGKSAIDKKINDALQFLDDNELVFNTLKVKDGKMEKGEDYVVRFD